MLLLLLACGPRPPLAPPPPDAVSAPVLPKRWAGPAELSRVRMVAVGDVLMHTNVKNSAKAANEDAQKGMEALFSQVKPLIESADLAFANLETPVAPDHHKGTRSMVFNAAPELLPALYATGFDVLSFANNHVYDQGRDGFEETMERLDASEMTWIGGGADCAAARKARLVTQNEITVAFIGSSKVYNDNMNLGEDKACSFELSVEQALAETEAARAAGADLVVVSVHWGREYRTFPEQSEVDDAHALVNGGVDLVLGHHAHVVQPVEVLHREDGSVGVIAYSLGNFISNQRYDYKHGVQSLDYGNPRDGLALQIDAVRKDYGKAPDGSPQIRVELANVVAIPLWTDNDAGRIVHPTPVIRVIPTADALEAAYAQLEAAETVEEDLAAKQRIALLEDRWNQVEDIVGEGMMPKHP